MVSQPLYDLSPVLQMLVVGLLLALVPVGWLWLRHRRQSPAQWLRRLTLLTLFLTFDLVVFGAFTRLTDSGLGCPDWPGCYGSASPVGAKVPISAAQAAMPSGPVTHTKAWIEMIHRYLATVVGALILAMTLLGWQQRNKSPPGTSGVGWGWPLATLVWVCIQGAFGALTVTMKLFPAIVTMHLLGGLFLLVLLTVQAERLQRVEQALQQITVDRLTRAVLLASGAVLAVQIALGGWVSTNYAVLACTDFPKCQGSWWPPMRFDQGFQFWRALGQTPDGENISFAALTAIHFVHRAFAIVVVAVLAWLVWRLRSSGPLRPVAGWIAALLVLQLTTGLANVVLGWPLLAAVLHTGGAAALVVLLTWAASRTSPARAARHARWPGPRVSA